TCSSLTFLLPPPALHPPLPSFPTRRSSDLMHNTLVGRGPLADPAVERLTTAAATAHARGSQLLIEPLSAVDDYPVLTTADAFARSEEHTSELQSPDHLVCRLLLEKKNYKRH